MNYPSIETGFSLPTPRGAKNFQRVSLIADRHFTGFHRMPKPEDLVFGTQIFVCYGFEGLQKALD
jgi:hypothetical protein